MNKVRLISQQRQEAAIWVPNRYEFNAKGRLLWLQRLLFWTLNKLKAYSYDTKVTYTTTEIDTSKILDALMQNQCNAEMLYHKRAKYVVMGPSEFSRFSGEMRDHAPFMQFNFDARVGFGRSMTTLGLECVVVPWIEGFFVMPELNNGN